MAVTALDHIYAETTSWESSLSFWGRLGFSLVELWGSAGHRAGRLTAGSAAVVLAEVDRNPDFTVFFRIEDPDSVDGDGSVVAPLHDTHWGTRMIRVQDPDGRIHALEAES
jgi:catechol 2,3-dioxygenase-like lactoylglutathione lyase family enzyme